MYQKELKSLLEHNQKRYKQFTIRPFFKMIENGELDADEFKRRWFFNFMQVFADYFQIMIYARQGTCLDNRFYATFLEHLKEEMGHDDLLRYREKVEKVWDPILSAIGSWFTYQMIALDNVEKAALMHLVLESAGEYYHTAAIGKLGKHINSDYYGVHSESDERHMEMAMGLFEGYPEFVYRRLHQLLDEGWDMITGMIDRVYVLVNNLENTMRENVLEEVEA